MGKKKIAVVCPSCLKERIVQENNIKKSGHSLCKSCARIEKYKGNYIGGTFGRLTIISDANPKVKKNGLKKAMVNCVCSCGKKVVVDRGYILCGDTKSCGCLNNENKASLYLKGFSKNENITNEEREQTEFQRKSYQNLVWKRKVIEVFGGLCCICGSHEKVAAHHLNSFAKNPELRFDIENGVALCSKCHFEYHMKFMGGYKNYATLETFEEFARLKNDE